MYNQHHMIFIKKSSMRKSYGLVESEHSSTLGRRLISTTLRLFYKHLLYLGPKQKSTKY